MSILYKSPLWRYKRIEQLKKNSQRSSYDKYIIFFQEMIKIAEASATEGA